MKTRNGFVSNSSTSSFLIPINALKKGQILMIQNHVEKLKDEEWYISIKKDCIFGWSDYDNFNMITFLFEVLRVNKKYVFFTNSSPDGIFALTNSESEQLSPQLNLPAQPNDYANFDIDLEELNKKILKEERKDKLDNINNFL